MIELVFYQPAAFNRNCGSVGGAPWNEQPPGLGASVQNPGRFVFNATPGSSPAPQFAVDPVGVILRDVGTFASGAADFMTLNTTKKINEWDGGAAFIDYNSGTYRAGKITGLGIAVTGAGYVAADIAEVQAGRLFGTRLGGNQPLLNSNDTLRIGWSYVRSTGQYVFRIGGTAVGAIKANPHINLWPPSWWFK